MILHCRLPMMKITFSAGADSDILLWAKEVQNLSQSNMCKGNSKYVVLGKILKSVKYLEGWLGHYSYWLILYHLGIRPLVNTTMRLLVTDTGGVCGVEELTQCYTWQYASGGRGGVPAAWLEVRQELTCTTGKHGTYPIAKLSSFTSFLCRT